MSDPEKAWRRQLDALAQQWLEAWRTPGGGAAGAPSWHEGLEFWSRLTGQRAPAADEALERFNTQARGYFELMRTVSERMQGERSAADVAKAWRESLSAATGGNPMLDAISRLSGEHARGIQQLAEGAEALAGPLRAQFDSLLGMPAFGIAREHQERAQSLVQDASALQQAVNRYNALLMEAGERAFALFEAKLAERSEPGRQVESARALYDLWIDAAEEAYAEVALSPRFRQAYGELVNAQMRVRQGVQRQAERAAAELDLPTRRELDSAHRRVHELQRELRRLRERLDALEGRDTPAAARTRTGRSRSAPPADAGAQTKARGDRKQPAAQATPRPARTGGKTGARAGRAQRRGQPAPAQPKAPATRRKRT